MLGLVFALGFALASCPVPELKFLRAPTCGTPVAFSVRIAEGVCHPASYLTCGACNGSMLCDGLDWADCFAATGCAETTSFWLANGTAIVYNGAGCAGTAVGVTGCLFDFINVCGSRQVDFAPAILDSECVPPVVSTTGDAASGSGSSSAGISSGAAASSTVGGSSTAGTTGASSTGGASSTAGSSTGGLGGSTSASTGTSDRTDPPVTSAAAAMTPW